MEILSFKEFTNYLMFNYFYKKSYYIQKNVPLNQLQVSIFISLLTSVNQQVFSLKSR